MKKITLFAAAAFCALAANAQYTTPTPYADQSVEAGKKATFDLILAAEDVITGLEGAGQKVNDWRVDDVTRFLYVWDNTFTGGDGSFPGVGYNDMQFDGYSSLNVGNVGWSGAGFFMGEGSGVNTEHWTDDTKFHVAVRTSTTSPNSVAFVLCDGDNAGSAPAKVALGDSFNDGGAIYPTIGPRITDEWTGIEISFADLKRFYPSFNYVNAAAWTGNIVSILGGGVEGQNISLDCMYFYTPSAGEGAVSSVSADSQFVVTGNTINVANGNGIELYDLSGRMIKSANGTTMGIDELGNGIYVARSGNSVVKIMK